MTKWLKKKVSCGYKLNFKPLTLEWYPSSRCCVKSNMRNVEPQQMPPLMIRKPAWRR